MQAHAAQQRRGWCARGRHRSCVPGALLPQRRRLSTAPCEQQQQLKAPIAAAAAADSPRSGRTPPPQQQQQQQQQQRLREQRGASPSRAPQPAPPAARAPPAAAASATGAATAPPAAETPSADATAAEPALPPEPQGPFSRINPRVPDDDDGSEGSGAQHPPPPARRRRGAGKGEAAGQAARRPAESDESRAYRRTSFTWKDWRKHRSTHRYLHHLSTTVKSRIVRGLLRPVAMVAAFAAAICGYQSLFAAARLPAWLPPLPAVPMEPFQLTSFALSLLLVFRTNTAYARWHEARCVFGRIADAARDILRQVMAVFPAERPQSVALMARWLVAYCYASKWALREEGRCRADLEGWLAPDELDKLVAAPDPAHYAMLVMSHALRANLVGQQLVKLQELIGGMMYHLSSCNRILTTPIPLSYTRHTTRFMVLWLLTLPLALWAKCGWGTVPIVAAVSLALLTIEAIGVSLEEPFSILALEHICDNCARSIATLCEMDADARRTAGAFAPPPGTLAAAGVVGAMGLAPEDGAALELARSSSSGSSGSSNGASGSTADAGGAPHVVPLVAAAGRGGSGAASPARGAAAGR